MEAAAAAAAAAATAAATTTSALQITLHPTTIINISDHYTRVLQTAKTKVPRVVGGLLGTQSGRAIEIHTAFSLLYEEVDGVVNFDFAYLKEKRDLLIEVLAGYEFLGWYTTGFEPTPGDLSVMAQLRTEGLNESPLLLIVDPTMARKDRKLPVYIYETTMRFDQGAMTSVFVSVPFRIDSGEAERIAVDHIAHLSSVADVESSVVANVRGTENSIDALTERLEMALTYLKAMRAGSVPKDHRLLRHLSSVLSRIPVASSPDFSDAFTAQYADVLLATYLASLTSSADAMNTLISKYNVVEGGGASLAAIARMGGMH